LLRVFAEMLTWKKSEKINSQQFKSSPKLKFARRVRTPLLNSKTPLETEKGSLARCI